KDDQEYRPAQDRGKRLAQRAERQQAEDRGQHADKRNRYEDKENDPEAEAEGDGLKMEESALLRLLVADIERRDQRRGGGAHAPEGDKEGDDGADAERRVRVRRHACQLLRDDARSFLRQDSL